MQVAVQPPAPAGAAAAPYDAKMLGTVNPGNASDDMVQAYRDGMQLVEQVSVAAQLLFTIAHLRTRKVTVAIAIRTLLP